MHLERLNKDPISCVDCTACVAQCRFGALSVVRPSHRVVLDASACTSCGRCIDACGYGALALVPLPAAERGAA
jgi:anaerobic carbon-monoxide dehydrogenase iron sulfur subunit